MSKVKLSLYEATDHLRTAITDIESQTGKQQFLLRASVNALEAAAGTEHGFTEVFEVEDE